ncbi:MAG: hypothetical protein Q8Q93_11265 [Hydrogenophaga sp.]|nr:hypothetical protein [Hydrogenophaga sp.]
MELDTTLEKLGSQQERLASLQTASEGAHYAVAQAVQALNAAPTDSMLYLRERSAIDQALLHLAKAKWYMGRFSGSALYFTDFTASMLDADLAGKSFARCLELAGRSRATLEGRHVDVAADQFAVQVPTHQDSEILFADGVPLVPTVCPIVLLQGSSYEMGRQYIEQVVDVYGSWIFEAVAKRRFSEQELLTIRRWHKHLERLTPEICDMVRGWVDAAHDLGIALDYWNAIQLWTGHFEPIAQGIKGHGIRDLAPAGHRNEDRSASAYLGGQSAQHVAVEAHEDLCSGCCAWGEATSEGKLVAASTTDHDCTFQATVVAYPDTGHAYVYTPFSVNGFIPQLGQYFFAGHPGMNDQGLAYVHHGGGLHGIEGPADRGYGLRRGASTFHNLRYASNTEEALAFELTCPIGDVGTILGSVGGFYADAKGAYVCEARPSPSVGQDAIVRTNAFDTQGQRYSFLYANNNSMHPRSSGGFQPPESGYSYNSIEGWFEDAPAHHLHLGPIGLSPLLSTKSSQGRNRYHFETLQASYGRIDVDTMQDLLRGSPPARRHADGRLMSRVEIEKAWLAGNPWPSSVCHRVNAFTSIMRPDNAGNGLYMGCIGPANRRTRMHIPGHGYHYYDEVNEFWEIRLKDSPEALVDDAKSRALSLLAQAQVQWKAALTAPGGVEHPTYFLGILERAREAWEQGTSRLAQVQGALTPSARLRALSAALRRFTDCQCRAKQLGSELSHRQAAPKALAL